MKKDCFFKTMCESKILFLTGTHIFKIYCRVGWPNTCHEGHVEFGDPTYFSAKKIINKIYYEKICIIFYKTYWKFRKSYSR